MGARRIGGLIAAVFGLVFFISSADGLPHPFGPIGQIAGIVLFLAVAASMFMSPQRMVEDPPDRGQLARYLLTAAVIVLLMILGGVLLRSVLHAEYLMPMWLGLLVGAHFVAFAQTLDVPIYQRFGIAMVAVSIVGTAVALVAGPSVAAWSGLVEGLILFAAVLTDSYRKEDT